MFTSYASKVDPIISTANLSGMDMSLSATKAFREVAPGKQVGAVSSALEESARIKGNIAQVKTALKEQLPENKDKKSVDLSGPAAGGSGGINLKAELASTAIGMALFAANPVLGTAYMAATTGASSVKFVASALSPSIDGATMTHAGVTHAAVDGGASAFKDLGVKAKKADTAPYEDVLGGVWKPDGSPMTQPTQQPAPAGQGMSPKLRVAAEEIMSKMGEDKVRASLAGVNSLEQEADKRANTAKKFAENQLGVQVKSKALEFGMA